MFIRNDTAGLKKIRYLHTVAFSGLASDGGCGVPDGPLSTLSSVLFVITNVGGGDFKTAASSPLSCLAGNDAAGAEKPDAAFSEKTPEK